MEIIILMLAISVLLLFLFIQTNSNHFRDALAVGERSSMPIKDGIYIMNANVKHHPSNDYGFSTFGVNI